MDNPVLGPAITVTTGKASGNVSNATKRLVDSQWYLAANPDVAAAGADPVEHYLRAGSREGRNANALFDTAWYAERNPGIDLPSLEHYVRYGVAAGCDPNPWFDSAWYLQTNPDVAAAGVNPLEHYLNCGANEGRNPHPLFHSAWYLRRNPAAAGMNPLEHYLSWGAARGISPHPLFNASLYSAQAPELAESGLSPLEHYLAHGASNARDPHPLFSASWYLAGNPDVASTGMNPLVHFLRHGGLELRDPHPLFDSRWYSEKNPDLARSGGVPLLHYVLEGAREGRSPHPLFDPQFYLAQHAHSDVPRRDPLQHYLSVGWRRSLKPHPDFDPAYYLREYADVRESGSEPLTHFIAIGRAEGRLGVPLSSPEHSASPDVSEAEELVFPPPPLEATVEIKPLPRLLRVAISVLFFHREDLVRSCLRTLLRQLRSARAHTSLRPTLYLSFNYQPSAELRTDVDALLEELPADEREAIHLVEHGWNLGFGAGHNAVLHRAECDLFVMLNSDIVVENDDWIERMADRFWQNDVAIVGLETTAGQLRADGCGIPVQEGQEFDFLDGSLLAIRSDLAARFGLFSDAFDYFYFEDADLCLRYRQMGLGLARIDIPHAHDRSASSRLLPRYAVSNVLNRNRARFFARWGNYLQTRKLPNRLAIRFEKPDRQLQCASFPALFALLAQHPTAILDIAGVHEQLVGLFGHPRIRLIPSWQTLKRDDYARFSELEQSTSSEQSRVLEVANAIGCTPNFEAAREHLRALVNDAALPREHAARAAMVYVSRVAPLFAGREPAPADFAALQPTLAAHGYTSAFYAELATFELAETQLSDRPAIHAAATATALDLLRRIVRADLVISADHFVAELSQLVDVKTFVWLGAISPSRAVWNFEHTGFFHDPALPCLGCYHRYGQAERNTCLRGDIACMRSSLTSEVATALDSFLKGAPIEAAQLAAPQLQEPRDPPAASTDLSLDAWPRSSAAAVLVLIPINPLLDHASIDRATDLANRAIDGMQGSRVVVDSEGEAPLRGLPHPLRQAAMAAIRQGMIDRHLRDERWVFWVDADIVEYPASLIDELIGRAEGGIAAPLVLMEGNSREPISNKFGFGPGRFYDVAGFVEHGRWARFTPPYFDQLGPVYQLDSVGSCYLVNADLYRHGAKHSLDSASRDFIEADAPWPDDSISRNQAGPANCFTEHYSVCEFARNAGLPVQAFADLIAYHERPVIRPELTQPIPLSTLRSVQQLANPQSEATVVIPPAFTSDLLQRTIVAETARPFQPRPLVSGTEGFAEAWLVEWHRAEHETRGRDVSCYFGSDAIVSGTGQVWLNDRLVTSSAWMPVYVRDRLELDRGGSDELQEARELPIRTIDRPCVLLAGHGVQIYGHFLTEMFFRLRIAQMALSDSGLKCKVLLERNSPDWILEILRDYFQISADQCEIFDPATERVLLREAVLPELAHDEEGFHPVAAQIVDEWCEELPAPRQALKIPRIFVSRASFSNPAHDQRVCTNESKLAEIAGEHGFTAVSVETLSWGEQIGLFRDAELVVGLFGSGLHNALFSRPGTRVGATGRLNLLQSEIGRLRQHENAYLDTEIKLEYAVDEDRFRAFMAAFTS